MGNGSMSTEKCVGGKGKESVRRNMMIIDRIANETAREYALRVIRENIISLDLEPGSRISENEMAAELGISRTPVREALIELSKNKVVEIYPQKGSYISLIDYALVEEAEFMRLTLEKAIIEVICEKAGEGCLKELEQNIKLQEFYIENNDPIKLLDLDNRFHKELFLIANKEQTYKLLRSMMIYYDRMRNLRIKAVDNNYVVEDHRAILEALKERDAEKGKQLMVKHLTRYKVDSEELRELYPQYFKKER